MHLTERATNFILGFIAVVAMALGLLYLSALFGPAWAHSIWKANSWVDRATNKKGERCCDAGKDCHQIPAERVKPHPRGYLLPDYDNAIVPSQEVIPSEDGQYWICIWGGQRRCFFAPWNGS